MSMKQRFSVASLLLAALCVLIVPAGSFAQSVITGEIRDASGAVLPGVTVEVASPALIEGSRTAITDGQGLYRIVDLRSGTYVADVFASGLRHCQAGRAGVALAVHGNGECRYARRRAPGDGNGHGRFTAGGRTVRRDADRPDGEDARGASHRSQHLGQQQHHPRGHEPQAGQRPSGRWRHARSQPVDHHRPRIHQF